MIKISKRTAIAASIVVVAVILLVGCFYLITQSLVASVIQAQLQRQGFAAAQVKQVRLYLDGIVLKHIQLDERNSLTDVFVPQSAPDIAKNGIRHVIIHSWDQAISTSDDIAMSWPFPQVESLTVETMRLHLDLPLQKIVLSGTLKSLRPEPDELVLILPFDVAEDTYNLQGKVEADVQNGRIVTVDLDLDDGSFQSDAVSLKRLSGWFNAQLTPNQPAQIQAQFMSGAVMYNNQPYVDSTVQYSQADETNSAQWTVTLNRAAEDYFNSWVIKPTLDKRYAIQIASQNGAKTKSAVMVSAAPLQLEPLLPATQPVPGSARQPLD